MRSRWKIWTARRRVAIGREQKVDLVFVGTVLEARTQESNKSGWIPSIKGQSGSVSVHRVKATVTLQGELYEVASGKRIFSVRVTGNDSNNALGGTAYTTFGAWGTTTTAPSSTRRWAKPYRRPSST